MIALKDQKNKSKDVALFVDSFSQIRELNVERREKIVQRQILGIREFIEKSREKNSNFSWSSCPWPIQFLPVITKFYSEWGKINAVNPVLSGFSGLMGMSKMEVNNNLNKKFRPRNLFFKKLPKSRKILENKFITKYKEKINYPVILKPNIGERASGVSFIREDQIEEFLSENIKLKNIILEEFIQTEAEFGLSWSRDPETKKFKIISLVQKNTPRVLGDGKKELKKLIAEKCIELSLDKSREKKILEGFLDSELSEKIIGEKNIVRTASVSFGTSFEKILVNPGQEKILIKLVQTFLLNFAGIYAGRFDIKSNNFKDLLEGKCYVLEMNGVGGTPLEIYDSSFSIKEKYEVLFNYFSHIFAIADKNIQVERGEKITKLEGITTLARNFFGKTKTQELPESVWKNLKEVFQISLKGRFQASDLGIVLQKFKN